MREQVAALSGVEEISLHDGRRVEGCVDEGYGAMREAFIGNFTERGDLGAACTVYAAGRVVVDMWGGLADARSGRVWERDTPTVMFSCTKGVVAICAYRLVQDGRLDLDAPIARYWPAFGQRGKDAITVRQAMSHRAGLATLDHDLTLDEVLAWEPVIRAIEVQGPLFSPSAGHMYHAMTYGWLVGEVIRRITGLMPGAYLRSEVADRMDLQTWIGLPLDARGSVAWVEPPLPDEDSDAARAAAHMAQDPLVQRTLTMGGAFAFPDKDRCVTFNDPAIQAAQIPGANGISTAQSLARLYAACVSDVSGTRLLTDASVADALRVQAAGSQLSGAPDDGSRWGTGFQLASPPFQPMIGDRSLGHAGAGGQLAFADAEYQVGFAYLTNQMGGYGDARARRLIEALVSALGR